MAGGAAAVFKVLEFAVCAACLAYKRYTDDEAVRVYFHLQRLSREWPLLNNVTWDENGALLADAAFGGLALVALGLLVAVAAGEIERARRTVCFFLVAGCVLLLLVGGLCLAAIDRVPHHLVDNAVVLGVLSVVGGLLFLLDLAFTGNKVTGDNEPAGKPAKAAGKPAKAAGKSAKAAEKPSEAASAPPAGRPERNGDAKQSTGKGLGNGVLKELRSSLKRKKPLEEAGGRADPGDRGVEFEDGEATGEPEPTRRSDGRQHGRRWAENRGFPARTASDDSGRFSGVGERHRDDFADAERDRRFDRVPDRPDSRASVLESHDGRRSRRASASMELELDERYLGPQEYRAERRFREERRLQDHRVTSSRGDLHDDAVDLLDDTAQLPSVSFLLSERGRKVLPSLSASPVERLEQATRSKPRYYYNQSRDPASGSSAPPSPLRWGADPDPAPNTSATAPGVPTTLAERLQQWARGPRAHSPASTRFYQPA